MKISIKNGAVTLAGNNILEQIDFEIKDNEHIAIVGRNGAEETYFLELSNDEHHELSKSVEFLQEVTGKSLQNL